MQDFFFKPWQLWGGNEHPYSFLVHNLPTALFFQIPKYERILWILTCPQNITTTKLLQKRISMRCPIDSTTHWRRCWQENCLSPFGLQDIHTYAKASPKQPEAALLISQCMFSLCSACVTSAAPRYLRQEKIVCLFFKCAISRAGNMFLQPRVARGFIELWKLFRSDFSFFGLCDGRFHGFCSSTHTTHGGDPRWLKKVIIFFVLHEMFCILGSHRIS